MARKQVSAVGAFIFDSQDRIFLAKCSRKFGERWSIPGGKIEFGEEPLAAVIREAKEETNIDIEAVEFFCTWLFLWWMTAMWSIWIILQNALPIVKSY